jgi:hypothetical protein
MIKFLKRILGTLKDEFMSDYWLLIFVRGLLLIEAVPCWKQWC